MTAAAGAVAVVVVVVAVAVGIVVVVVVIVAVVGVAAGHYYSIVEEPMQAHHSMTVGKHHQHWQCYQLTRFVAPTPTREPAAGQQNG